jgi:hypothetical protein
LFQATAYLENTCPKLKYTGKKSLVIDIYLCGLKISKYNFHTGESRLYPFVQIYLIRPQQDNISADNVSAAPTNKMGAHGSHSPAQIGSGCRTKSVKKRFEPYSFCPLSNKCGKLSG